MSCDTHGVWRLCRATLLLAAVWPLTGCGLARHDLALGPSLEPSRAAVATADQSGPRPGQRALYGPPASAAAETKASQFNVSNPRVDRFVEKFQTRSRNFYQRALERGSRYLPKIKSVLREENVPRQLAYLPLIESGFRTHAVSHAGAVGPWQFMRATGRRYGLRIDRYVDERRDPVKATYAAARYLKDLYAQFGDWHLSLAAYNTGEMNVARALERDTAADDYWGISAHGELATETCEFVPRFLAAVQIAQAPEAYGFDPPGSDPLQYDIVQTHRSVSLRTVAKLSHASVSKIRALNPALRRGVTPPHGYAIRVPKGTKQAVQTALTRRRHAALASSSRTGRRTYRMRRGDTLGAVARHYGVSVRALMRANRIRNPRRVAAGRVLHIPRGHATRKRAKSVVRLASRRGR